MLVKNNHESMKGKYVIFHALFSGDTCGYDPGDELGANIFYSTRELPCNIKLRENSSETVRITSESWAESPINQDTYTVPIFHLYECGRDAECTSEQKCKLKDDDSVRCR